MNWDKLDIDVGMENIYSRSVSDIIQGERAGELLWTSLPECISIASGLLAAPLVPRNTMRSGRS